MAVQRLLYPAITPSDSAVVSPSAVVDETSVAQPVDEQTARSSKPAPAARAYDRELVEAVKRFQAWQGLGRMALLARRRVTGLI